MGFWKGAVGTKKQKIFWSIFSVAVAVIVAAIIFFLLPKRVHETLKLKGGEWAHYYPDPFWHGSAKYEVKTSDGKAVTGADAYVYNIKLHGNYLDYDMKADGIDCRIADNSAMSVLHNWNSSITVTDGSSIAVTIDAVSSATLCYIATTDEDTFKAWADNEEFDKDDALVVLNDVEEISSSVDIPSAADYYATQRLYVGIKVTPGSNAGTKLQGYFYHHIARVNVTNCTHFESSPVSLDNNARQLLQIDVPEECTSETSHYCTLSVVIEPRWGLFFGIVVIPACAVGCGFVIGMMAIKAFHVRQMIAIMRKKASEEGVALEEGKSKDIHQERLDEAAADGEEHPEVHSEDDDAGDDVATEPAAGDDEKKPADDNESSGAAVLTAAPETD